MTIITWTSYHKNLSEIIKKYWKRSVYLMFIVTAKTNLFQKA